MKDSNKINISVLAEKVANSKWMLSPAAHASLTTLVEKYMEAPYAPEMPDEEFNTNATTEEASGDVTAVISVGGILVKGATEAEQQLFGLCDTDYISNAIDDALADDSVKDICLAISSPGGETTGIEELGRKIKSSPKPIYGWTETLAASAAYWILSQCQMVGMTPSAEVGSVGVYSLIEDITEKMKNEGVKIEAISAGKYKLIGHSFRSLTDEERSIMQQDVDDTYNDFKATVTSTRSIADEDLQGLTYGGKKALEKGFVDVVVDNLDEFLTTTNNIEESSNMKNFTKVAKQAVTPAVTEVAKAPVTESVVTTIKVKAEEAEPTKEPEKVEIEEKHEVMCPHCKKGFEVNYDPTTPDKDKNEEIEEPEKKAEVEPNEPHKEPDEDDKKAEAEGEKEEPKKDEKKKMSLPTKEEWNEARGYTKVVKSEVSNWNKAIADTFKI